MDFSEKLNLLLKRNGMSVLSFSKTQNISHTAVAKWLKNKARPSPNKMLEIATFFDLDVDILLDDSKNLPNETTQKKTSNTIETIKIEDDFKKLISLRNEITETFNEFATMFDKRLSNIEKILKDKKF